MTGVSLRDLSVRLGSPPARRSTRDARRVASTTTRMVATRAVPTAARTRLLAISSRHRHRFTDGSNQCARRDRVRQMVDATKVGTVGFLRVTRAAP